MTVELLKLTVPVQFPEEVGITKAVNDIIPPTVGVVGEVYKFSVVDILVIVNS
jgi:hypothetical protein